jgi:hypothetical protein
MAGSTKYGAPRALHGESEASGKQDRDARLPGGRGQRFSRRERKASEAYERLPLPPVAVTVTHDQLGSVGTSQRALSLALDDAAAYSGKERVPPPKSPSGVKPPAG